MKINEVISVLEAAAPPSLQESYDNAGLITGSPEWTCTGILCSLDATEAVVREAIDKKCNLVVAHHPIIFGGLKKINGKNYVEQTIITAIKNDIAIYAIHTNLDNMQDGVNGMMAKKLGLQQTRILAPKAATLKKIVTFVPEAQADMLREALFAAGAGRIGDYTGCSFNAAGTGTFRPGDEARPFAGEKGKWHQEPEIKMEMIFEAHLEGKMIATLRAAHPYEEPAFDILSLSNPHPERGSGLVGELAANWEEARFLALLKEVFGTPVLRHSALRGQPIRKVAICGGAGSFLIVNALSAGVDAYITSDLKYHEFFDANDRLLLVDVGHYESEQYTMDLLQELLAQKFRTFAVLKTAVKTNPVHYS